MNTISSPDFIEKYAMGNSRPLDIIVIGAGGTGSALMGKLFLLNNTLRALTGTGIRVKLYDDDVVTDSNIGRQTFYPFDLGENKAKCLIERFSNFGAPNWSYSSERFTFDQEDKYRTKLHNTVIFGCVDNVKARKDIHMALSESSNCIWIDAGNDNNSVNVVMAVNAKTQGTPVYLPSVYDLFKQQMDEHIDSNEDSCSAEDAISKQEFGVNDMAASHQIQLLWQLIRHGKVDYQGVSLDLTTGTSSPISPDPDLWSMYGYVAQSQQIPH